MAHANDSISKALFSWRPMDFVQWFMPGATFVRLLPTELIREPLRADGLFRIQYPTDPPQDAVLHLEVQTKFEADFEQRCCLYNLLTQQREQVPVHTTVIL